MEKIRLSDRIWKEFNFVSIFEIKGGFYNKKPVSTKLGTIPFLGATDSNNGVTEFYTFETIETNSKTGNGKNESINKKIFPGNSICVTNNGSVGYAYYQKNQFTCSHDVNPLYLKNHELNQDLAMFLITCIEQQKVCFEYSRKWRPKRMVKSKIMLPVLIDNNDVPDYDFMESYIKAKTHKFRDQYNDYLSNTLSKMECVDIPLLSQKTWREFLLVDIFEVIQRGKRLIRFNQKAGNIPYVSSSALNNGVDNFVSNSNVRLFSNCLTIANSGSVGASFYHPYTFVASDHVTHLKNTNLNKYVYLFIATMTQRLSDKYNFNREINDKRISKERIILPVNDNDEPDFYYMEQYTKNIMIKLYSKYRESIIT